METRYFRLKQYGLEHLFSVLMIWPLGIYKGSQLCINICIKKVQFSSERSYEDPRRKMGKGEVSSLLR